MSCRIVGSNISFEGLHLGPGEGVGLADDWDDVDAVPEPLHQLQVQGLEAVTNRGEEVEERVYPGHGSQMTQDPDFIMRGVTLCPPIHEQVLFDLNSCYLIIPRIRNSQSLTIYSRLLGEISLKLRLDVAPELETFKYSRTISLRTDFTGRQASVLSILSPYPGRVRMFRSIST